MVVVVILRVAGNLPGAAGADNGKSLAAVYGEVEAANNAFPAKGEMHVAELNLHHTAVPRRFIRPVIVLIHGLLSPLSPIP